MSQIKAIIVDDEPSARENLSYLLANFCDSITVVASANHIDTAVEAIKKHQPDVVFLDIEMPEKNGFQLLKEFAEINFQIIFITAYDEYAIKAFEVSAIDYLLKPIDIDRLVEAVDKLENKLHWDSFKARINVLKGNKNKISKISIPHKCDYAIISVDDIIYIEADRMYSHVYTKEGKKYTVAKKLSYYESLLFENEKFRRVHRSWLVNLDLVNRYSKGDKKVTILDKEIPVSKSYKEETAAYFNH